VSLFLWGFFMRLIILSILLIFLSACGVGATDQQTMVAYNTLASTQRSVFYLTATVDAERGFITLDAIQDRIDRALDQRQFMLSTLEARGVDTSQLPQIRTPTPVTLVPDVPLAPIATSTATGGDVALPTSVIVTPLMISPTPFVAQPIQQTPIPNTPLRDIVMSQGVGDDDCAVGVTNNFPANTPEIYVVARAVGVSAGTNLATRWLDSAGIELAYFEFTPDFTIDNACIWFFADNTDFPFVAGGYTVVFEVNSAPASAPIPFTIAP
jgi:hypothetical protein